MAGTEPRALGSVAQHHAEGRVAGGCRRVEGRSRQVPALLQPQAGIRALNVVATPRPLSGIRAVRLAPGQAAELRGRTDSTIADAHHRSEEHTSELQSLMPNSYAVFCLKKKKPSTQSLTRTD